MKVYLTLLFRMKVPRIRGDEGSKWIIAINMYYYLVLMQLNTVYSYSLFPVINYRPSINLEGLLYLSAPAINLNPINNNNHVDIGLLPYRFTKFN